MELGNDCSLFCVFFADMYNRFKIVDILKQLNTFDEKASKR